MEIDTIMNSKNCQRFLFNPRQNVHENAPFHLKFIWLNIVVILFLQKDNIVEASHQFYQINFSLQKYTTKANTVQPKQLIICMIFSVQFSL